MPKVSDIAAYLEKEIPTALKEDYDNVGLLCGFPEMEVNRVLVSLDVTMETIREADRIGAQMIAAHHPVIFSPLYRLRDDDLTGSRIIQLIKNGISAVCMHTNLDALAGGVNDALAGALEVQVEERLGIGCVCRLAEPASMELFTARVRDALNAGDIRFYDAGRAVERIAICGGAGGDIIYEAANRGCDTVLTGEIKHHQWIDGKELGLNLIDAGHYSTEAPVVEVLAAMLRQGFPELDIAVSASQGPITRGLGI